MSPNDFSSKNIPIFGFIFNRVHVLLKISEIFAAVKYVGAGAATI